MSALVFLRSLALFAGSILVLHGTVLPARASAGEPLQLRAGAPVLEAVTPTHFSGDNRYLYGELTGSYWADRAANLFAVTPLSDAVPLTRLMIAGNGPFRVRTEAPLTNVLANGVLTVFASPSRDGSHQPGPRASIGVNIVVPAPEIVSAVGSRNRAEVRGRALPGASVRLELAGQQQIVRASGGPEGDWHHAFSNVPEGQHRVMATVIDDTRSFPDSITVQSVLEVEGTITRPLTVTTPPENSPVQRRVQVRGVASPERGNVLVRMGEGPTVEAAVHPLQQTWSATVTSLVAGQVPLQVSLPQTGETIRYNLDVQPWGTLTVTRFELSQHRSERENRYLIEGTATLDEEVRYGNTAGGWTHLADVADDGHWRYSGPMIRDLPVRKKVVDGLLYEIGRFNVPSAGEHQDDGVEEPRVRVAPELTSPLTVTPYTQLRGIYRAGLEKLKLTLPDGQTIVVPVDREEQTWSAEVGPLPLGRHVVELGADIPPQASPMFATRRYTLDVQEEP